MKKFKCRASKTFVLNTGYKEIDSVGLSRILELENERDNGINTNGNKVKWTDSKIKEYNALLDLKKNPKLGQTFITYLEEWYIEQMTGVGKFFSSKETEHGIATEKLALKRAGAFFGCEFVKNEIKLENEYFTGEFDTKNDVLVIDTKSCFSAQTFPYFVNSVSHEHYSQLQTYMDLTGLKESALVFCLENGTDAEIERLAWSFAKKEALVSGEVDFEMEIKHWELAKKQLNYDHLPDWMRIKAFPIKRDDQFIDANKARVLDGRKYIKEVLEPQISNLKISKYE